MTHTKLPWEIKRYDFIEKANCAVIGSELFDTCLIPSRCDEERANAAFIVKAVNNFYRLLEVLKDIDNGDLYVLDCTRDIVRKAIKEAECLSKT